MSFRLTAFFSLMGATVAVLSAPPASAEEGMWTFDNFPAAEVNARYGTQIDQAWLDHVRGAAVRISGCSASVVSGEGLILTNDHCVRSCVQALSTADNDYIRDGWMPATRDGESVCPGQTADILIGITDVTARVQAAGADLTGAAFVRAREAEIAAIEHETCGDDRTVNCDVVSLYRGGQFALYKFRRYEDVRLAFAPEDRAASFGGDPDNFNFPRYSLDAAFLRLYENGAPAVTPDHLRWNPNAPAAGDVTFVAGNPGSTQRLLTMAQLERLRDQQLPLSLIQGSELRGRLLQYAGAGAEAARVSVSPLSSLENTFKVNYGQQAALTDAAFMAVKRRQEAELRAAVAADPSLTARIGDPWTELERVETVARDLYLPYRQLEAVAGQRSDLYGYARQIVRTSKERAKPPAERRAGYTDAEIEAIGRRLAAVRPISTDLETMALSFWLSKTREYLTVDNADVRALLGRESPEALAARLVAGSRLADPAFRAEALAMTPEQLAASDDEMIRFVLAHDDAAQAVRAEWESAVTAPTNKAGEKIAQARFALYGTDQNPDATFSLRLSYGSVQGWTYRGAEVTPFTTFAGLYERATGSDPFDASPAFVAAEAAIDKDVVYNFTTSNDIIGGNSGSPVINAAGEVIGVAFDGNIHSLGGSYGYDGELNRTVVVSTAAVTEALRTVYRQPRLLAELGVE